jgi:hypothetical protein
MWSRNFLLLALLAASGPALAGEDDAVALGRKLMAENGCNGSCHQAKAPGGDPAKLYTRADAKVKSLDGLKRQVERCVAMVGAQIMPDETDSVVAALNHDYYKFK